MLGINCIKLMFGYLYFSPIIFQKYNKKWPIRNSSKCII